MSSLDLQTVVIACPNCGTRYQVPYATIGPTGREVQCAQCSQPWHAMAEPPLAPDDDVLFSPEDESALDDAFEAVARTEQTAGRTVPGGLPRDPEHARTLAAIKAAVTPRAVRDLAEWHEPDPALPQKPDDAPVNAMDPALLNRSRRAFERRQARLSRRMPAAQMRRTARLAALVVLAAILLLGLSMRQDLVRWFPALAGLYESIGLPVNVVGLTFSESRTLTSYRDGKAVMLISADIRSVASRVVPVPPVLVTLLDERGTKVYEWTVASRVTEMEPGEVQEFSTELTAPPAAAVKVRLSFANPSGPVMGTAATPTGTL